METKTDQSFGIIPVYKDGDDWKVLVIHQISHKGDIYWNFPKGHAEGEETPRETALRELREETSLTDVTIDETKVFESKYTFTHDGVRIKKTVMYYLGVVNQVSVTITQPQEIKEIRWCTFAEAEALLTHQGTKKLLQDTADFLSKK